MLYKYEGQIESERYSKKEGAFSGKVDMILDDYRDRSKAPIRIEAIGALADYINEIEGTDAEERYIFSTWYYDELLYMRRIEIPGKGNEPAKVVTSAGMFSDELEVFGPDEFIEEEEPESMDKEESARMYRFAMDNSDWWYGR